MKEQDPISLAVETRIDPDPSPLPASETPPSLDPPEIVSQQPAEIPVEKSASMIDIHPPQHAPMTKREFFVHLFIVVLGILIAIGLEQTVEYFQHRNRLAEARRQLAAERDLNREVLEKNLRSVASMQAELDRDVSILNEHLASPRTPLSGPLNYSWILYRTPDGAWQAVRADGSLGLMSGAELRVNTYRYEVFDTLMNSFHDFQRCIELAGAISRRPPSSTPSQQTTQELLSATSAAQGSLAVIQRFLGMESDSALRDATATAPERENSDRNTGATP